MHMKNMSKYAFQENALSDKIHLVVIKIEKKLIFYFIFNQTFKVQYPLTYCYIYVLHCI